jgi:hypothetical protein
VIPKAFSSAAEARNCLDFYIHEFSSAARDPSLVGDADKMLSESGPAYLEVYKRWNRAFHALTQGQPGMSEPERCATGVVQITNMILATSLEIMSRSDGTDDQMLWDRHTGTFRQIVQLSAEILNITDDGRPSARRGAHFTLDPGVVGPLYDVACRCRDPHVRRQAIALLNRFPRQEGMFDGVLAARAAERMVEIEEYGLGVVETCEDVPDWARMSDTHPIFDPEHKKVMLYYRRRKSPRTAIRSPVRVVIEWA